MIDSKSRDRSLGIIKNSLSLLNFMITRKQSFDRPGSILKSRSMNKFSKIDQLGRHNIEKIKNKIQLKVQMQEMQRSAFTKPPKYKQYNFKPKRRNDFSTFNTSPVSFNKDLESIIDQDSRNSNSSYKLKNQFYNTQKVVSKTPNPQVDQQSDSSQQDAENRGNQNKPKKHLDQEIQKTIEMPSVGINISVNTPK